MAIKDDLLSIIDAIPGLVAVLAPGGELEAVNAQFSEFCRQSPEELRSCAGNGTVHPDDIMRITPVLTQSMSTGEPYDYECQLRRFDGVYRWFQTRGKPVRDSENNIVLWLALSTEIDDCKRMEDQRSQAIEQLRLAQQLSATGSFTTDLVADEALRQREQYARQIIDGIPGMIVVLSADGGVEYANAQTHEYYGKPIEELSQWQYNDICHPDDLARAIELFVRMRETGETFDCEFRARRHDGVYLWHRSIALPWRDSDGTIIRWYNLLVDIDKRKRTEEAFAASEAELRRAYDSFRDAQRLSKTASFITDLLADDHNWSEEAFRIFEFEPGSKVTVARIRTLIHPDDLQSFDAVIEQAGRGADVDFLFRIVTSSGTLKYIRGLAHVVELLKGRPMFVGALSDVTESKLVEEALKASEAELRDRAAFLHEGEAVGQTGTFLWRVETSEITWSEQLYRTFGLDQDMKVTLELIASRVLPDDMPLMADMLERAQAGKDFEYEHRLRFPDGSIRHVHLVAYPRRNAHGQLEYIGAAHDITATKRAEDALSKARAELAHVARALTLNALTASIAHEVNQPLAGIVTNANVSLRMLSGNPPNLQGASAAAQRTLRDANRAADVISRLRSMFTRRDPRMESVDLNEVTCEVVALSSSDLQRNGVTVQLQLADGLPPIIGDRVQIQQVILNLILNASDAMTGVGDRPRRLLIRSALSGDVEATLTVDDTGEGFSLETANRLFDAFYTTKSNGMGMGLAISRSIIESHQGRLWAIPKDNGRGAIFSFSIPARAQADA